MHGAGAWKEGATKMNKFVLIGKDLDQAAIAEEFEACLDGTPQNAEYRKMLEALWEEEERRSAAMADMERRWMAQLAEQQANSYEVTLHNGQYGLGLLLSERRGLGGIDEVYIVGFAQMPDGVENEAEKSQMILPGDILTAVNGSSVAGWGLAAVIGVLRRLPRGAGASGADVALTLALPAAGGGAAAPAAPAAGGDEAVTKRRRTKL